MSDPLLAAVIAAEDAIDDIQVELVEERARHQAALDAPRGCIYGPSVPIAGFTKVTEFVFKTGLQPQLVRCYPGSSNSLSQVRTAIGTYPGAAIVYNMHVASKNPTQAQLEGWVKAIEVEALKVPRFVLCPDAEMDRPRSYTTAQFIASFKKTALAVKQYAPHVELSLNPTGWLFADRIGQYDELLPLYDLLCLDPYWEPAGTGGVQGSEKNLAAAVVFCEATGKRLGLAEWGATNGNYKLLSDGLTWIRQHPICELSCYYIEDSPTVPIRGALTTPEAFAVYRAGAS
jgi:hypothetical protein